MIAVTGASGFIGSNMIHYLNTVGISSVVAIDDFDVDLRLGYATRANYSNLQDCRFSMIHPIFMSKSHILPDQKIDAVLHIGAISNTLEKDELKIQKHNVHYTQTLGDECRRRGIPMIFTSSAAVYGNGNGPLNHYAKSKLAAEEGIKDFAVCLRLFNVYGPREWHKGRMSSVILRWWQELESTGTVSIFSGSERYTRDFIHVDDVCRAIYECMLRCSPGVYDFGTGVSVSFDKIADMVIGEYGSGVKSTIPMPQDLASQYQKMTVANPSDGIRGTISIEDGVKMYCQYLRSVKS